MEDDSSVLVTLLLTRVLDEGEVRCSYAETPITLEALLVEQCMNPQCRSSKQQPYPRLERLGLVAVESTDAVLLDDVHGIIRRSFMRALSQSAVGREKLKARQIVSDSIRKT